MSHAKIFLALVIFLMVSTWHTPLQASSAKCLTFLRDISAQSRSANFDYRNELSDFVRYKQELSFAEIRFLSESPVPLNFVRLAKNHALYADLEKRVALILARGVDWSILRHDLRDLADRFERRPKNQTAEKPVAPRLRVVQKAKILLPVADPAINFDLQLSGQDVFFSDDGRPLALYAQAPLFLKVVDALNANLLQTLNVEERMPEDAKLLTQHHDAFVALRTAERINVRDAFLATEVWQKTFDHLKPFFLKSFKYRHRPFLLLRTHESLMVVDAVTGRLVRQFARRAQSSDPVIFEIGGEQFALSTNGSFVEIVDLTGKHEWSDIKWSEPTTLAPQLVQYQGKLAVVLAGPNGLIEAIDLQSKRSLGRFEPKMYALSETGGHFFNPKATAKSPDLLQYTSFTKSEHLNVLVNSRWGTSYLVDLVNQKLIGTHPINSGLSPVIALNFKAGAYTYGLAVYTHDHFANEVGESQIEIIDMLTGASIDRIMLPSRAIRNAQIMTNGPEVYLGLSSPTEAYSLQLY